MKQISKAKAKQAMLELKGSENTLTKESSILEDSTPTYDVDRMDVEGNVVSRKRSLTHNEENDSKKQRTSEEDVKPSAEDVDLEAAIAMSMEGLFSSKFVGKQESASRDAASLQSSEFIDAMEDSQDRLVEYREGHAYASVMNSVLAYRGERMVSLLKL